MPIAKLGDNQTPVVERLTSEQMSMEEKKDLENLKPIDHAVLAKPHTPVYKMHRYFARRPYSVFNDLIRHYSNPGSIVYDPFCGGGVTVVESLRLRRKVIGVDINPLAAFITRNEVSDVNLSKFEGAISKIEDDIRQSIESLYITKCPKCKSKVPADWFEWTNVVECKGCGKPVRLCDAERVGKGEKIAGVSAGKFKCNHKGCNEEFRPSECKRLDEELILVHLKCPKCKKESEFEPTSEDVNLAKKARSESAAAIKSKKLWVPKSEMPDWWELRRPYNAHIKKFSDWFTKRNLLANAMLATEIKNMRVDDNLKSILTFIFSASLRFTNRIVFRNPGWQGGKPIEWASSVYWLPEVFCEINVWKAWENRKHAVESGKKYSAQEIGPFCVFADSFSDIKNKSTCMINTASSTHVDLPNSSVDTVITDPPYGNNVLYAELCNFYWVWISGVLGNESMIEDKEEAIVSKEHEKGMKEYRDLLFGIFKECYRILKPGRWMVMTFHNKDFSVWSALHLAAHDAGFILSEEDGMIYQPPISNYINTIQTRRTGSMLGDFILSFQKAERKPQIKMIEETEIGNKVRNIAGETIEYHGGAKMSTIYMKLIPFLLNNGLLHRFGEKDITPFLRKDFVEKDGKWYFKENLDDEGNIKPMDYVPIDARVGYVIRSLFYEKKEATMDEILGAVFSNLVNGNAAEYEEISRVLSNIAEKSTGRTWKLKGSESHRQHQLLHFVEKGKKPVSGGQKTLTGENLSTEESIHDLMIKQLIVMGEKEGYQSHVGQTEQRKYVEFRKLSIPMGSNVQYGLNRQAFDIIREIDLLWLKGDSIVAAFEVEKSTTIDSGINRFRNLFAATPSQNIPAYIIAPDEREEEAAKKIGSLANRKDGLDKRIKYMLFSEIHKKGPIDIEKVSHAVT